MTLSPTLSTLAQTTPSTLAWDHLCQHLTSNPPNPEEIQALQMALSTWPDHLRTAPTSWVEALLDKSTPAAWPLIRHLHGQELDSRTASKILKNEHLQNITHLSFVWGKLGTSTFAKALTTSPHLASVHHLSLQGCNLGDDVTTIISHSPFAHQLSSLGLSMGHASSKKHKHTSQSLLALATSPTLTRLKHLTLEGVIFHSGFAYMEMSQLAKAPHLQDLESLTARFNYTSVNVDPLLEHHSMRKLHTLELRDATLTDPTLLAKLSRAPLTTLGLSLLYNKTGSGTTKLDNLAQTSLPHLKTLHLHTYDNQPQHIDTLVAAPWMQNLDALSLDMLLNDTQTVDLVQRLTLPRLRALTIRRHYIFPAYQRSQNNDTHWPLGEPTARAFLTCDTMPKLTQLHLDLPINLDKDADQAKLQALIRQHQDAPPYPAWTSLVTALEDRNQLQLRDKPQAATPQALAPPTLDLALDYDTTAETLEEMLAVQGPQRYKSLTFSVALHQRPADLIARFFQDCDWTHLQSLDISSVMSWTRSNQHDAMLTGLLHNKTLTRLQTFHYTHWTFNHEYLPALLALKASPHLSQAARDQIKPEKAFHSFWSDKAMSALCADPNAITVTRLDLAKTNVGDPEIKALSTCKHMKQLNYLDLTRTRITDQGALNLSQAQHLTALETLKLGHCKITSKGAQALADSPHLHPKIKKEWARKAKALLKKEAKS